jgi:protease IV
VSSQKGTHLKYITTILLFPFRFFRYLYYFISYLSKKKGNFVSIKIPSAFTSVERSSWINFVSPSKDKATFFLDFLTTLDQIAEYSFMIKKASFFISEIHFGFAELFQITEKIAYIKSKGVLTSGFCEHGDLKCLYLLSFMDERFTDPASEFFVVLPSIESFFFGKLLKENLGIEVEAYASGDYKSFAEMFHREGFSPYSRENLEQLILSVRKQMMDNFEKNTGATEELFYEPVLTADTLLESNLVTATLDIDDFTDFYPYKNYKYRKGRKEVYKRLRLQKLRLKDKLKDFQFIHKDEESILIIPLKGNIVLGNHGDTENKEGEISYYFVREILKDIREDSSVRAVIFEIDSGGGSAFASELIFKEISKLRNKKLVYAFFQNVAASGGYYIATACHKIYATPYTITGSIGAVMVRPNLKGLYDKVGLTKDRIGFYPHREIISEYGAVSTESKDYLAKEIIRIRDLFYQRVTEARQISTETLVPLAEGRVFTGQAFLEHQMIDATTDLLSVIEDIKKELKNNRLVPQYLPIEYGIRSLVNDVRLGMATYKRLYSEVREYTEASDRFQLKLDKKLKGL